MSFLPQPIFNQSANFINLTFHIQHISNIHPVLTTSIVTTLIWLEPLSSLAWTTTLALSLDFPPPDLYSLTLPQHSVAMTYLVSLLPVRSGRRGTVSGFDHVSLLLVLLLLSHFSHV